MPKTETKATAAAPNVKEIDPAQVKLSTEGFAWREILVRMPEGMVADDLRTPKIWKRVQKSRQTALIKFDHLFVLGFDESFAVRAVVTHATDSEAHLAIEKVLTFREQGQRFWGDGTLEVFWDGSAYGVRRIADQVRVVGEGFTTEAQAITAAHKYYPTKAA